MHSGEQESSKGEKEPPAQALRESEGRFRLLIDDLQVGILIQGTRSEVLFANRAALGLLGLTEAQILGKTSFDASSFAVHEDGTPFPGEDHPGPRALVTGRPVRNVVVGFYRPVIKDRVWLLVSADPHVDADGKVREVICTLSDVTAIKRAEDRLRESETRYRQLVEKAQDIIFRTDVNGFFTYVNPVASRVMGLPEAELVGKHFSELIREDHRGRVVALLVSQFRQRIATTYDEFAAVARDGREVWFGQHVQLLMEGDQVQGFQSVARDITERKRAEERAENERRQLREMVTHAPVAMAILDREGRYIAHSKRWPRLWGFEGQTIVGRAHHAVLQGKPLPEKYQEGVRRALAGEVVSDPEDAFELADGSRLYVSWSLQPWRGPEGAVEGVMAVVRNIDALVRARQTALDASRHKSEFLANVSHQLRTPLNAIIGMASLMLEDELDEAQRQRAQLIDRSGQQLLAMIDEVLDFSKAEAGQLELEVIDFELRSLVQDVLDSFAEPAARKGLGVTCTIPDAVPDALRGDPRRLRQVLASLVGNAVKFTEAGTVAIRAGLVPGPADAAVVRFEISDSGVGIHPDARPHLFEPFSQADGSTTRRYGGTGLGLAISKRLVEAMGGEIDVCSQPGRGSTFSFTARFDRQPPAAATSPAPRSGP
jgi:PAS domain S-box-containing protein